MDTDLALALKSAEYEVIVEMASSSTVVSTSGGHLGSPVCKANLRQWAKTGARQAFELLRMTLMRFLVAGQVGFWQLNTITGKKISCSFVKRAGF